MYNKYKDVAYDTKEIEGKTLKLIDDDEVQSLKGVYEYILTGEEKHLNLRQFDDKTKEKFLKNKKANAFGAKRLLNLKKWKPIT